MINKYLILLIFVLFSREGYSQCRELYLDRMDYAEKQFQDLDVEDEYILDKASAINNTLILKRLLKLAPKLKFSNNPKENPVIMKDFIKKVAAKRVQAAVIKNIMYQSRKAYFIKEDFKDYYYSLIIYVNLSCNPFTSQPTIIPKKVKKIKK